MIKTRKRIIAETKDSALIEVYRLKDKNGRIHTDNVEYIGNNRYDNSEIDNLPFSEDGRVDVDIYIMDKNEYCSTIIVNSCDEWELDDDDTIAVIIVNGTPNDTENEPSILERTASAVLNARKAQGITISQLSHKTGINPSNLSRIERGEVYPNLQTLASICDALGLTIEIK